MSDLAVIDKKILNILQEGFPVSIEPYQEMAEKLAVTEDEILRRIAAMKASGIIRRIGGVFDSGSLGFYSTLCACRVPEDDIDRVAVLINEQKGVTHNYLRDHDYNLWFTLTAPSYESAMNILKELEKDSGIKIVSMPTIAVYKIKVSFEMGEQDAI